MITPAHVHEAAHAVIAVVLGIEITAVTLDGVRTRVRVGDVEAARRSAIVALCGLAAEFRHLGLTGDAEARAWREAGRSADVSNMFRYLDAAGGGEVEPIRREAVRVVHERWPAIRRTARRLAKHGTLDAARVAAICELCPPG